MNVLELYLASAKSEEACADDAAALLHCLSAFCHYAGSRDIGRAISVSNQIKRLQLRIGISDQELLGLVHPYGQIGAAECRALLSRLIACVPIEISDIEEEERRICRETSKRLWECR